MPEVRLIDANALIRDIAESVRYADEWEKESREKNDEDGLKCAIETRRALLPMISRLKEAPTIEADIDRAAILRLCNAVEDLAADIGNHTMMDVVYAEARMIFDKAKEIGKELTKYVGTD